MQAFRGVEIQLHTLSTTVNGHEWFASCQATPCPLNRRLGGNQNWHGHFGVKKNLFPCQESNYVASAVKPVAYYISTMLPQLCLIPASTKKL